VPNGATLNQNNLDYLDNCIDYFENKDKIILAVDQDEAGMALQHEFIRRLGAENCYLVDFHDCKDANEYLGKYGPEALANLAVIAKPVPLENVSTLKDVE
jgi:twinkle protein